MNSKPIRQQIQKALHSLSSAELSERSHALCLRAADWSKNLGFKKTGLFCALDTEVDLTFLAQELEKKGTLTCYPRINDYQKKLIEFVQASQKQSQHWKVEARFGITEPAPHLSPSNPKEISLIFVPAVAFSERGDRLGRGQGYYDRFLASHPEALRVGVGFEEQIIDEIQSRPWDALMDWVITDRRTIQTRRRFA